MRHQSSSLIISSIIIALISVSCVTNGLVLAAQKSDCQLFLAAKQDTLTVQQQQQQQQQQSQQLQRVHHKSLSSRYDYEMVTVFTDWKVKSRDTVMMQHHMNGKCMTYSSDGLSADGQNKRLRLQLKLKCKENYRIVLLHYSQQQQQHSQEFWFRTCSNNQLQFVMSLTNCLSCRSHSCTANLHVSSDAAGDGSIRIATHGLRDSRKILVKFYLKAIHDGSYEQKLMIQNANISQWRAPAFILKFSPTSTKIPIKRQTAHFNYYRAEHCPPHRIQTAGYAAAVTEHRSQAPDDISSYRIAAAISVAMVSFLLAALALLILAIVSRSSLRAANVRMVMLLHAGGEAVKDSELWKRLKMELNNLGLQCKVQHVSELKLKSCNDYHTVIFVARDSSFAEFINAARNCRNLRHLLDGLLAQKHRTMAVLIRDNALASDWLMFNSLQQDRVAIRQLPPAIISLSILQ